MISTVIACRNDPLLQQTIQSLRGYSKQLIVVDDGSTHKLDTTGADLVHRLPSRLGPGPARQVGADMATEPWLMFCDSHMIFPENWYGTVCRHLESSSEQEIWCSVWKSDVIFDSMWHETHLVAGADFYLWRHDNQQFSFSDLKPRRPKNEPMYDVPCVLGGCYFVHRSWFEKMGGFSLMIGYGSEEAWLSWNTWLMGGYVKVMGDLHTVHIHQTATSTQKLLIPEWETNRLMVLKRILPEPDYRNFCSWLPIHSSIKDDIEMRGGHLTRHHDAIPYHMVSHAFHLQTLDEAIELMQEFHHKTHKAI